MSPGVAVAAVNDVSWRHPGSTLRDMQAGHVLLTNLHFPHANFHIICRRERSFEDTAMGSRT
jgi:hypothetical protein